MFNDHGIKVILPSVAFETDSYKAYLNYENLSVL